MRSAFSKEVIRSITGSWGRVLAIAGIVALGCGFYAGLRMTAPDMRITADSFYDGTQLYDIDMLSTLGFSDDLVDQVAAVDGVESVMPGYSTDVMATLNDEQYAIRVNSLPVQAAADSSSDDGVNVASDDDGYLNRLVLAEGSWPTAEGECVLSADRVMGTPIQIGDKVDVLYGSQDLDGVLETRSYTVVGLVHSSSYISSVSLGTTALGSGVIQQYMYVAPGNFDSDYPYTEVFVKVAGADGYLAGSDAYKRTVGDVAQRLDDLSGQLSATRLSEVEDGAQRTLDEKKADYERQKSDAYAQLDDAGAQLDAAAVTLAQTRTTLDDGAAKIGSGQAQLDDSRQRWQDGYSQWQQAASAWSGQRASLVAQLSGLQGQLDGLQTQLSAAQVQLGQLQVQETGIQQAIAALDPLDPNYTAEKAALEQQLATVQAGIVQVQTGIQQLETGITQAQTGIQQVQEGITQGDVQVSGAKASLDASKAQIDAGQAALDDQTAALQNGYAQLAEGQAAYDANLASYKSARAEADQKFADARSQIDDAQTKIDDLASPSIYVLDRTKNYGVASFDADAGRVDNIAQVFPFIFFLVAALVALTTMTRMVDEERGLIGTYKALGYGTARITGKYLLYAGAASLVGSLVGILLLSQVLPAVICRAYSIIYSVPQLSFPLPIDLPLALISAGLGIGVTLIATWAAVATTLRETPALLMLPRAPKAGKRILLERFSLLWKRLSFSWKVTCRNLFRYRKRFWMTMIGIAGCTALLLTGLGLHDAIWDIITNQFDDIIHYNVIVRLDDSASNQDAIDVENLMAQSDDASDYTRAQGENMQIASASHSARGANVVIPQDAAAMGDLVTMRDRVTGVPTGFDDESVVLTEKLAKTLGVSVGDTVTLYDQDAIGNPTGQGYDVTVTGIMENYVGDYVNIGKAAYTAATGKEPGFTSIYARCTTDTSQREAFTDELHAQKAVDTVTYNDETIDGYRKMLSSVNMIVVVLVTAAAALAFIVLYNLTNINITERRREIASLKVLGFTTREVDAYIFREIGLLTALGALLGLVLGVFLEGFVVVTAEVDQVMFGRAIHPTSFFIAFALTLVFSAVVMLFMRRKLDGIDMVESLKSVE